MTGHVTIEAVGLGVDGLDIRVVVRVGAKLAVLAAVVMGEGVGVGDDRLHRKGAGAAAGWWLSRRVETNLMFYRSTSTLYKHNDIYDELPCNCWSGKTNFIVCMHMTTHTMSSYERIKYIDVNNIMRY